MDTIEKATIIHYHRELIRMKPGDHIHGQGWKNLDSQQKRFEALTGVGDISHCTVLDMGCGYGDLKAFLDKRFHDFTYVGTDHLPEFIEAAQQIYKGAANAYFYRHDFVTDGLPEVDYVLASGVLSYHSDNLLFPFNVIRKMYDTARKGVAFNLLDKEVFERGNLMNAYDQVEMINFCRGLASRWEVVNGYLPGDFTIYLYKEI